MSMMSPNISDIVWSPERLQLIPSRTLAPFISQFSCYDDWPSLAAINQVAESMGFPLTFAKQRVLGKRAKKRRRQVDPDYHFLRAPDRYERLVIHQACVPTRPGNCHDFFNALTWFRFPLAKTEICQQLIIACENALRTYGHQAKNRPVMHDLLTSIDESGLVCVVPHENFQEAKQILNSENLTKKLTWFSQQSGADVMIFGHGLLENLYLDSELELNAMTLLISKNYDKDIDIGITEAIKNLSLEPSATVFGSLPLSILVGPSSHIM